MDLLAKHPSERYDYLLAAFIDSEFRRRMRQRKDFPIINIVNTVAKSIETNVSIETQLRYIKYLFAENAGRYPGWRLEYYVTRVPLSGTDQYLKTAWLCWSRLEWLWDKLTRRTKPAISYNILVY